METLLQQIPFPCRPLENHQVTHVNMENGNYKSLLPPTDPRDAVPHAHCAVRRCRQSV